MYEYIHTYIHSHKFIGIYRAGSGGGFLDSGNPPPLPYACTFSKRNKAKKQPLDPARGPMRPPGPPAETPPYD